MLLGFGFGDAVDTRASALGAAGAAVEHELWHVTTRPSRTFAQLFEPKERKQLHGVVGGYDGDARAVDSRPAPLALRSWR